MRPASACTYHSDSSWTASGIEDRDSHSGTAAPIAAAAGRVAANMGSTVDVAAANTEGTREDIPADCAAEARSQRRIDGILLE